LPGLPTTTELHPDRKQPIAGGSILPGVKRRAIRCATAFRGDKR
jgi:hypothetical protein